MTNHDTKHCHLPVNLKAGSKGALALAALLPATPLANAGEQRSQSAANTPR